MFNLFNRSTATTSTCVDKRPMFMMLVGLPHTGKSAQAEELSRLYDCTVVSTSIIRTELYGEDFVYRKMGKENSVIYQTMHERIISLLQAGKNVVYEATNIRMKTRMKMLEEFEKLGIDCMKICYYLVKPFDKIFASNRDSLDPVNEADLISMFYNFDIPYYYEGWDKIEIVWADRLENASTRSLFKYPQTGLCNFTQGNIPAMKYNVGHMMEKAHDIANKTKASKDVAVAALFCEMAYPMLDKYRPQGTRTNKMSAQESVFYSCLTYRKALRLISDNDKMKKHCLDVAILIQWKDVSNQYDFNEAGRLFTLFGNDLSDKIHKLNDIVYAARVACNEK